VRAHPGIEILVNNLGVFEPKPFEQIGDAEWTRFFEINVVSGIRLTRLCLPAMKRANWGRIIFISSESAVQIPAEMIQYGTTKTAQLAVSRGLAEALAGTGITVNCVLPGPTKSRGVGDFVEALAKSEGKSFPSHLAHQTICHTGGGRGPRGLRGQSALVSDDRRCPARRRRRDQKRFLTVAGSSMDPTLWANA
jgi:NAD(P)-dependent dehydrogenase (short-subunit alcohol dehydrogenase family)